MSTAVQPGLLPISGKPVTTPRICLGCDNPIPAKRLLLRPSATLCAPCQERVGDVATYRDSGLHKGSFSREGIYQYGLKDADEDFAPREAPIGTVSWADFNDETKA